MIISKSNIIFLKKILRVFLIFLILYSLNYFFTYLMFKLALSDYNKLNISPDRYLLLINILTYIPLIVSFIILLLFLKIKLVRINLDLSSKPFIYKFLVSFLILYFATFIFHPINNNFEKIIINKVEPVWIDFTKNIILFFIMVVFSPILEELFFRVLLLNPFIKNKKDIIAGIIITSVLFSMSHFYILNYDFSIDFISLINFLIIGIILSVIRLKYGVLYSITSHIIINLLFFINNNFKLNLFFLDYLNDKFYYYWFFYLLMLSLIIYFLKKFKR